MDPNMILSDLLSLGLGMQLFMSRDLMPLLGSWFRLA